MNERMKIIFEESEEMMTFLRGMEDGGEVKEGEWPSSYSLSFEERQHLIHMTHKIGALSASSREEAKSFSEWRMALTQKERDMYRLRGVRGRQMSEEDEKRAT